MSLRRGGAAVGSKDGLPLTGSASSPPQLSALSTSNKQNWISGGLALLVVGVYVSSLSSSSASEGNTSETHLRSSSSQESAHRIPDFKPIHEQCKCGVMDSLSRGVCWRQGAILALSVRPGPSWGTATCHLSHVIASFEHMYQALFGWHNHP